MPPQKLEISEAQLIETMGDETWAPSVLAPMLGTTAHTLAKRIAPGKEWAKYAVYAPGKPTKMRVPGGAVPEEDTDEAPTGGFPKELSRKVRAKPAKSLVRLAPEDEPDEGDPMMA
jgi:hypothetical protein